MISGVTMDIREILHRAKVLNDIKSDVELARHLGVSKQTVSDWTHWMTVPNAKHMIELCKMADVDEGPAIAEVYGVHGLLNGFEKYKKAAKKFGLPPLEEINLKGDFLAMWDGPEYFRSSAMESRTAADRTRSFK